MSVPSVILEEGMKWEQISIPPEDAQFIDTLKFQKSDTSLRRRAMAAEFRAHELLQRVHDTLASGDLIKRPFQASLIACDEGDVAPLQRDIRDWLREYEAGQLSQANHEDGCQPCAAGCPHHGEEKEEVSAPPKCPYCQRPVIRVERRPSLVMYVHAAAGKDGKQVYGCAAARSKKTV
ncbi:MAG: hypothetical protein ABSH44_17590 [Bryobacteraceae bacterium]|jgi:hypothetical protein